MVAFLVRRVLVMIPTMVLISIVSFIIIQLPPGDYLTSHISRLSETGQIADDAGRLRIAGNRRARQQIRIVVDQRPAPDSRQPRREVTEVRAGPAAQIDDPRPAPGPPRGHEQRHGRGRARSVIGRLAQGEPRRIESRAHVAGVSS